MSDGVKVALGFGGYAFSCMVAAAIAKEWFGVPDHGDGPPAWALCGVFWPLVVAFWCAAGVFMAMWWLAHTPVRVVGQYRRRRITALEEVERLLRQ